MSASGHGLGVLMAIIFLAGEMAGVGVLALPKVTFQSSSNFSIILTIKSQIITAKSFLSTSKICVLKFKNQLV